jgi:hypothetical protein
MVKGCRSKRTLAGQAALEAGGGAGEHELGVEVELLGELALPLLGQVRRAEHGEALGFAAVEQLAAMSPASMVLPMPTSSAMSRRTGSSLSAISRGTSW